MGEIETTGAAQQTPTTTQENTNEQTNQQTAETGETGSERSFTQADLDRILNRERAKWSRQQEKAVETARTEAERLANMTAEERARETARAREEELTRREAEISRREMRAQALDGLTQRGLPQELLGVIDLTDADKCKESMDAAERAFRASVQKGVEERLRGSGAPKSPADNGAILYDAQLRHAMGLKTK